MSKADRSDALQHYNERKNRFQDIVPSTWGQDGREEAWAMWESFSGRRILKWLFVICCVVCDAGNNNRVKLRSSGDQGSDYINASYVDVSMCGWCGGRRGLGGASVRS